MKYFYLPTQICHLIYVIFSLLIFSNFAIAQKKNATVAPDQDVEFLTKILDQISPGIKFNKQGKYPLDSFEIFQKKNEKHLIMVTFWQYKNYRYPLFLQVIDDIIEDIYLAFPSFMLHDRIHEMLIKKWGNQQFYKQSSLSAIYQWSSQKNQFSIYEANCSLTCFPVFLALSRVPSKPNLQPLWLQFQPKKNVKVKK